jgi:hypothetical protein
LIRDRLQAVPDKNHEGTAGDGEIGVEKSVSIVKAAVEVLGAPRRCDSEDQDLPSDKA